MRRRRNDQPRETVTLPCHLCRDPVVCWRDLVTNTDGSLYKTTTCPGCRECSAQAKAEAYHNRFAQREKETAND